MPTPPTAKTVVSKRALEDTTEDSVLCKLAIDKDDKATQTEGDCAGF
eukprot:CAMPEP_0170472990 /NCGR_PEP_ID=MMETSP0123-20130129/14947_1 /TAXON_ID=182087 /ORGANISM="Favella ehrenbergii, Strain Fehren 1" /LENGTH=46 /DNA_ID= /DNA_START= /DNA_END= /DNA_ORIENTATION=